MLSVFVMLPFRDEYDDVYMVISDAVKRVSAELSAEISCARADEFGPGKITEQIILAIRNADIVIADLTGSNPNVMYELGFAHGLEKNAIILNQDVHGVPFDVKDFRQIVYDRNRLLKDCQPRIISFLKAVLSEYTSIDSGAESELADSNPHESDTSSDQTTTPLRASISVVAQVQAIHVQLEHANAKGLREQIGRAVASLTALLDRLVIPPGIDDRIVRGLSTGTGNCAVELEEASMFAEAENVYRRAVGLFPQQAGIHLQFADFLIDAGRFDEARAEIDRAREIDPASERLVREEVRFGRATRGVGEQVGKQLAEAFASDPSANGTAYLFYLDQIDAPLAEYEAAWQRYFEAVPDSKKLSAKRYLADQLASSSDSDTEQRGLDLYEEILPSLLGEDRHAVLHNMATLYATRHTERARTLWTECYRMRPGDERVRIAFSQFLSREGETELAVKVAGGERF